MKGKELMVGDWAFSPEMKQPITIKAILEHNQVIFAQRITNDISNRYLRNCSEIEPIPLTPEILEKNGFEFNGTKDWVFGQNQYGNINAFEIRVTPPQPNNEYWDEEATGFEVWDKNSDIIREGLPQIYVHELQHALRLCGIEKEIVI